MNMKQSYKYPLLTAFAALLASTSCKQEFLNPNSPTEQTVLTNAQGLITASNGLRFRYSVGAVNGLYSSVSAAGLSTGELRVVNAGNAAEQALFLGGGNVTNVNALVTNLWTSLNVLNADCDRIIANVGNIPDQITRNAVQANAHLFKSLALGQLAIFWENVAFQSSRPGINATFESRASVLDKAVKLCDDAVALLGNTPLPVAFTSVVGTNIDLVNSLNALSARYNLMLGRNAAALAAANRVVMTSTSLLPFDNVSPNPLFRSSFTTNNVTQAAANLGLNGSLAPDASDGRLPFYLITTGTYSPATPGARGFFKADNDPIPLYLPGEIILIKAEAYARLGTPADLANAVLQLNLVRQKATDPLGINANLPAYSGPVTQQDILNEIYRQARIELYLTGLSLEYSRRFGRPGPGATGAERTRNFYPYPFTERNNNPNTPNDPAN
jgi:starch-binding outer membrane protein, SusD/RagB family